MIHPSVTSTAVWRWIGILCCAGSIFWALPNSSRASRASEEAGLPAIVNPSFEDDVITGAGAPSGWTNSAPAGAVIEFGGHRGGYRLSHWQPQDYSIETSQALPRLPGGWYTLRAWVRRSAGRNRSFIQLRCGDEGERVYLPVARPDQWLQIVTSVQTAGGFCAAVLHTDAAGGEWSNFDDVELVPGRARLSALGADVSSLHKSEDLGGIYLDDRDGGGLRRSPSALEILAGHGASHIRLRVWVNPADGYHEKRELLEMARRAKAAGLKLLVDIHYSDTWTDPGQQRKPAAWSNYTIAELRQAIYDYTFDLCQSLKLSAEAPDLVQIGNELNSGMLWPDGHTWNPPRWENLGIFLKAGYDAVKASSLQTKVMLHLANGGDNGLYRWWFDNITAQGVQFDVIGVSYYGFWHGSLGDLQSNLNEIAGRYDKDVVVAETAYPFTLANADGWPNLIGNPNQLVAGYPATPEGQAANFRDVMSILRAVPNGRGLGLFYWDATWTAVPGNGWNPVDPSTGNAWENQALFDFAHRPLPAMGQFKP
ncbi:MAG TPA: arabinogalactan endo-1,4-beta-galactosidase [Blastocatellia bacterium]|nr:arabinogalactan endo-1,4-beta-galactosidase [Blastocatellia bacterium]